MKTPQQIITEHCAAIGRRGGSRNTPAQHAARRANGAKAPGWPKGKARKPKLTE